MASRSQETQYVHPEAAHARKRCVKPGPRLGDTKYIGMDANIWIRAPSLFFIEPIYALGVFFVANLISALYNPIQDCDETFNFWEPTHYLTHGYGLQTWEWSPEYGIRDWLYIIPHAVLATLRRFSPQATKVRSLELDLSVVI